jgi:hypothetical protein
MERYSSNRFSDSFRNGEREKEFLCPETNLLDMSNRGENVKPLLTKDIELSIVPINIRGMFEDHCIHFIISNIFVACLFNYNLNFIAIDSKHANFSCPIS